MKIDNKCKVWPSQVSPASADGEQQRRGGKGDSAPATRQAFLGIPSLLCALCHWREGQRLQPREHRLHELTPRLWPSSGLGCVTTGIYSSPTNTIQELAKDNRPARLLETPPQCQPPLAVA
jgi:hypothetical protein